MDGDRIYDTMYDRLFSYLSITKSNLNQKDTYMIFCQYIGVFTSSCLSDTTENSSIWDHRGQISHRDDSFMDSSGRNMITIMESKIMVVDDRRIVDTCDK
jgi:hypothetical protein